MWVFTALRIQAELFWIATPCSFAVGHEGFGGPSCLHFRVKWMVPPSFPPPNDCQTTPFLSYWLPDTEIRHALQAYICLFRSLHPEDGDWKVLRNVGILPQNYTESTQKTSTWRVERCIQFPNDFFLLLLRILHVLLTLTFIYCRHCFLFLELNIHYIEQSFIWTLHIVISSSF